MKLVQEFLFLGCDLLYRLVRLDLCQIPTLSNEEHMKRNMAICRAEPARHSLFAEHVRATDATTFSATTPELNTSSFVKAI